MHVRSFTFLIVAGLLASCGTKPVDGNRPTATVAPSATMTPVPATETSTPQPTPTLEWPSQLEMIRAGNWSRLQLLKTFPAERPLEHSAVAISPDGKTMVIGASSGANILFYDLSSGQSSWVSIKDVSDINGYFDRIEYLPDGTLVANSSSPYMTYHFDASGNVLSTWENNSFAISADKKTLAYGTVEGINLVDIASNKTLSVFGPGDAMEFSFSPDGSKIAVDVIGVDYVNTQVWDIATQTMLTELAETANVRYSPSGKFLAVTSYEDETTPLKVFSPDGATEIITLKVSDPNGLNNRDPLWSLDGSVIAAQIANGSPVAWETTNWQMLENPDLQGELDSFSPDGRILITRAEDGVILLWGVLP